jgi:hypothetical protein
MTENNRNDNIRLGIGLGAIYGSLFFLFLRNFEKWFCYLNNMESLFGDHRLAILILFTNMILFRWLVVDKKLIETGKGVFLVTFVAALSYIVKFKVKV